jgi:hypothetical protein
MATHPDICGFIHNVSQRGFCKLLLHIGRFFNLVAGFVIIILAKLVTKNKIRVDLNADFIFLPDQSKEVDNSQIITAYSF